MINLMTKFELDQSIAGIIRDNRGKVPHELSDLIVACVYNQIQRLTFELEQVNIELDELKSTLV